MTDDWWNRHPIRRSSKRIRIHECSPQADPRLAKALKAMDEWMEEKLRTFLYVLDAWLLLATARHGVLPEEIRERCLLEHHERIGGKDHILIVDGKAVERLEERYNTAVHDTIEVTFTPSWTGISPLITAEMLYPRFWRYPKCWRGQ